ncbi:MAG: FecR domain-containing protein [Bacteriovoracaceae bacterium]|nr:FecR domain-containing protein [Bacteriovoracaceae bacterium]
MKNLLVTLIFLSSLAQAAPEKVVATVKMMRGKVVKILPNGVKETMKATGETVVEGTVITTENASFAQLRFIDNSVVNVGPNSEMKIEQFSKDKPGLLSVVKGEIRSQVTKDYLEISKDERDKLYVKSKTAAMGIRGTDFIYSFNPNNDATTAVLMEGEVAFAKLDNPNAGYDDVKRAIINDSVTMYPGEFSVAKPEMKQPTIPAVLNIKQRDLLTKNHNNGKEDKGRAPASADKEKVAHKSTVPAGLNGQVVANDNKALDKSVKDLAGDVANVKVRDNAEGFVKDGIIKPANGSMVHLETGVIIPPAEGSQFDKNTNSYISDADGKVLKDSGDYRPMDDSVKINENGKILVSENGRVIAKEPPHPILGAADKHFGGLVPPPVPDALDPRFVQGGLNQLRDNIDTSASGTYVPSTHEQNSTLVRFNIDVQ